MFVDLIFRLEEFECWYSDPLPTDVENFMYSLLYTFESFPVNFFLRNCRRDGWKSYILT